MRITLSFLSILLPTLLLAQNINGWLPVKVNHKLGFINNQGAIIVEPKYDAVGQRVLPWNRFFAGSSNFRLVELDKKLGLIDQRFGNEVLAPNYTQIRPLHDTLFVVTLDSLFTLVNRDGKILIDARYEDIRPIYDGRGQVHDYFMVQVDNLWGVHKKEAEQIFAPQFGYIEMINQGKGYFKVKETFSSKTWELFNGNAEKVLQGKYHKIEIINDDFILAFDQERRGRWSVWNYKGMQILDPEWYSYRALNDHMVAMKKENRKWYLYLLSKNGFLESVEEFDQFYPLNEDYILAEKTNLLGILDSLGNVVLQPTFTKIEEAVDPYFKVRKKQWGLFSFERGLFVPCIYQAIADFDGLNALVKKNDLYGVINTTGKEIIPTKFEEIQKEDNFYKGFIGTTMTLYEMSDSGTVISEDFFPEVYSLSVGFDVNMFGDEMTMADIRRSGRGAFMGRIGMNNNRIWSPTDSMKILNSPWNWEKDPLSKKWGLTNTQTNQIIYQPQYQTIRHIPESNLTMVYSSKDYVLNRLTAMVTFPVDTASTMALFSHYKGDFITDFEILGLNRNDFQNGARFARFIDKEGKFGLIDKEGKVAKDEEGNPLKFSFIGNFENGKARACLGGKIAVSNDPKFEKISPDWISSLVFEYWVTPTRFFLLNHRKKFFFEKDGENEPKWGYIDSLGKFIIDPIYDFANPFIDSLAINQKGDFWGLIDENNRTILDFKYAGIKSFNLNTWKVSVPNPKPIFFNNKGHEIIGLQYSKFKGFSDGMCAVKKDALWGFVNDLGEEVIQCQYSEVKKFSEGWAAVKSDKSWFFINKSGEKVLALKGELLDIEDVGNFNNGLCWFKDGKWYGFFDKKGKIKIEAIYTKAFDFNHNVARVVYERKTGLINPKGKWVLKPKKFEVIFPFDSHGIAEVREHFKQPSGLINVKGDLLTPIKYDEIETNNNGYYRVRSNELWGFLDKKGKEIIPTIYAQTTAISNGLVAVRHPSQLTWYYINTKNQRAFKGNFEIAHSFSEGFAFTQKHEYDDETKIWLNELGKPFNPVPGDEITHFSDGIFGMFSPVGIRTNFRRLNYYYSDKNGINIFNRHFENIEPFVHKSAPVRMKNKWGLINDSGVFVIEPKYSKINVLDNNLIHAKPSLLFGLTTRKGEVIIPPEYDYLEISNGLYQVEKGEQIGYLDFRGNWVWEIQK